VIQKTKALCDYVLTVTHKSPKAFRFTLVEKLQNYVLGALENMYRANELRADTAERVGRRKAYQMEALTDLKLLGFMSEIASAHECILARQNEQIEIRIYECRNLLAAWVKSDARRAAEQPPK